MNSLRPCLSLAGAVAAMAVVGIRAPEAQQQPNAPQQEPGEGFEFSIQNIMRGPELVGREPQRVRWTADSRWIYFSWLEPGADWRETPKPFRVRAVAGARPELVTDAHMDSVGPMLAPRRFSADRRLAAVEHDGDLYLVDVRRGSARRLTQTLAAERDPYFDADGRRVFFIRDNNVYSIEVDGGLVRQLTDIRPGPAPKEDSTRAEQRTALEAQQRLLFESVRDRLRRDSITTAERKAREALHVKPLYLLKDERVTALSVSPSGRALLVLTTLPTGEARTTEVPQYVTSSGYTEQLRPRTKVGDEQARGRVAFLSLPAGDTHWLRVVPGDTTRPPGFVNALGWNRTGSHALLSAVSRDWKARFIQTVSADSGKLATIDELRDSAWVNGPCSGCGGWYEDGRRVWFVSEADGYAHLYAMAADGSDRRQLTRGNWEVLGAELSPDGREHWLHTSEGSPFERHFYRMPLGGGGASERITRATGGHTVTVSPDGRTLANVHSTANRPPELFLMPFRAGAEMARLTESPTKDWLGFRWVQPEIVMIPASDGVQVPARIYRPRDLGAEPNGAGVIFVHGAGYLHNVHNYWSTYFREYMFNHYLASKGYVVLDIDYRGSAGYGRDWRTAIYRHMGGRDLQDHVDGSRYLQREHGIDPERVGIYGGSYGGFITLMALFMEPEWFGAGAALRSVTDWAHYNHGYTSRILNLPASDTLAYRRSSPIYFAEGLEDPLLVAHGMVDVNVHFQDVVRLSQRLIELGKTDWEMAVYPVEDHAFVRPSSWTDEYRRIFELFERHIGRTAGGGQREASPAGSAPRSP
ncbi:MAG: prolyl oligopeptidase family serine peptidase [Gemmatimonadota bacterium]|nr:prolyl oligopeptidase family serine peptidase [Gemmatimonadota bacterium]